VNGNLVSLLIGCYLNLKILNNESTGELISSIFTVILSILLIFYVIWSYYFLLTRDLEDSLIYSKFGELYPGLQVCHNSSAHFWQLPKLYHATLNLRRLLLISLIFALSDPYPLILYNLSLFYLAFGHLYYLLQLPRPFHSARDYRLELTYQIIICLTMLACWPLVDGHLANLDHTTKNVSGGLVIAGYCMASAVGLKE
jgi:hypothetical protein